jgi:hypothetical protein
VQLWLLLYAINVSTPDHAMYNIHCATWFMNMATKTKLCQRYSSASLRLAALLLHHPRVVNCYLRVGELNFNVLSTSRCME